MKFITLLSCFILAYSCTGKKQELTAQQIINQAIEVACAGNCENATMDFTFRDRCYVSMRNDGIYRYERITSDSTGVTEDVLTNSGFTRHKNNVQIKVADSMITKYSNSINSVIYFAQLPFGLNAEAVKKELLGEAVIKEEPYFEIGVSFNEEGGGTDFEDTFVYWIHKDKYTVDYLAYQYFSDGGGIRFREAYNPRIVNGIRFADYYNFKPGTIEVTLTELDSEFEKGTLKLLSKIETESVGVQLTNAN
jgi:hypothetical protein